MFTGLQFHLALLSIASGHHEDKLKAILDAHAASVAAIRTLSCKFTFKGSVRGQASGEYRRSGYDYFLRVTRPASGTLTTCSVGGQAKVLNNNEGRESKPPQGFVYVADGLSPNDCDPYTYNLLHFIGQLKFRSPLTEILAGPNTCRYVGVVERAGRRLERIELSHDRADLTIDFDPAVNYLARVVVGRGKLAGGEGKPQLTQEVIEYAEPAPGVYYPTKTRCYDPVSDTEHWKMEFTELKVNQPIPPATFTFKFPPRVEVLDHVRGGVYMTDAAGEPTQPAISKSGLPIKLATGTDPAVATKSPETPTRPTQTDTRSLSQWVLPAALTLLGAGVILGLVRRVQQARAT